MFVQLLVQVGKSHNPFKQKIDFRLNEFLWQKRFLIFREQSGRKFKSARKSIVESIACSWFLDLERNTYCRLIYAIEKDAFT